MKIAGNVFAGLSLFFAALVLPACGQEAPSLDETALYEEAVTTATPTPNPPSSSCNQRRSGVTGIQVLVRIDKYQGLINGRNGVHEIAHATITHTPWVYDDSIVDTTNAQLALNVKSAKNKTGLPYEIKLAVGQVIEVEGEYIPASTSGAKNDNGDAAVIHFTHNPCGYVTISGSVYQ